MQISAPNPYNLHSMRQVAAIETGNSGTPAPQKSATQAPPAANTAPRPEKSAEPKMSADMVFALLQAQEASAKSSQSISLLETGNGKEAVDLDKMYANERPGTVQELDLADMSFLLPNAQNISALKDHASQRFKQLLADYDIPEAPSSISYDQRGNMQLPDDYPYATELKQALSENPGLDRELHDLNALSSHFAAMQQLVPLTQEISNAKSEQQINQIIEKYSHLLSDNAEYKSISLQFAKDGTISINADDSPLKLA